VTPLTGRVALVTGAGKGIGAAVAHALAAGGGQVAVLDVDTAAACDVADAIGSSGGTAIALECDVADHSSVQEATRRTVAEFGAVDLLVANAGIGDYSLMSDGDPARWRRLLEVNVLGVTHVIRETVPAMKQAGFGDIVIMTSIAGRETWEGEPVYIASKHALVGLGGSLRKECAMRGVRVSLIEPTIVDTPLVRATELGRMELEKYASLTADDVARAVVYAVTQPPGVGVSEILLRAVGPEA
jgi:NADP-dependent 3-hydroxy acid dehydrogenase YdfG